MRVKVIAIWKKNKTFLIKYEKNQKVFYDNSEEEPNYKPLGIVSARMN